MELEPATLSRGNLLYQKVICLLHIQTPNRQASQDKNMCTCKNERLLLTFSEFISKASLQIENQLLYMKV